MTARLIDGRAVALDLRTALAARVAGLPYQPALAVVLVGEDPASAVTVPTATPVTSMPAISPV